MVDYTASVVPVAGSACLSEDITYKLEWNTWENIIFGSIKSNAAFKRYMFIPTFIPAS